MILAYHTVLLMPLQLATAMENQLQVCFLWNAYAYDHTLMYIVFFCRAKSCVWYVKDKRCNDDNDDGGGGGV